jgi:hypothetical protein
VCGPPDAAIPSCQHLQPPSLLSSQNMCVICRHTKPKHYTHTPTPHTTPTHKNLLCEHQPHTLHPRTKPHTLHPCTKPHTLHPHTKPHTLHPRRKPHTLHPRTKPHMARCTVYVNCTVNALYSHACSLSCHGVCLEPPRPSICSSTHPHPFCNHCVNTPTQAKLNATSSGPESLLPHTSAAHCLQSNHPMQVYALGVQLTVAPSHKLNRSPNSSKCRDGPTRNASQRSRLCNARQPAKVTNS